MAELMAQWLPFKCWVCQGLEWDESGQEVKVTPAKAASVGAAYSFPDADSKDAHAGAFQSPPVDPASFRQEVFGQTQSTHKASASSSAPADARPPPREHERSRLRELMKEWVNRGMAGVDTAQLDEEGALRNAYYRIDPKLQYMSFAVVGEEAPDDSFGPFNERSASFGQIVEALCGREAKLSDACPQGEALEGLSDEAILRLVLVVYSAGLSNDRKQVCFLEATPEDAQNFVTCVRILRRYMEEQGYSLAHQVRC